MILALIRHQRHLWGTFLLRIFSFVDSFTFPTGYLDISSFFHICLLIYSCVLITHQIKTAPVRFVDYCNTLKEM